MIERGGIGPAFGEILLSAVAMLFACTLASRPAHAGDKRIEVGFGAEVDAVSRYVWRGIALSKGPALQPSAWVWIEDFTISLWGNLPLHPDDGAGIPDELDIVVEWEREVAGLGIRASALAYLYPTGEASDHTAELVLELRYPSGPLGAYTLQALDVAQNAGGYWGEAGVALVQQWGESVEMELRLGLGWGSRLFNEANLGSPAGGLDAFVAALTVTCWPTDRFYLGFHGEMSALMRGELRNAGNDPFLVSAGLAAGVEID